jgi:hypothetical protein
MTERNEHHTFKAYDVPSQEISDPTVLSKTPLVSVVMPTYNHEPYIAQAIEGALMQKTNFPYKVLIGEDGSSDGTREICKEYAAKYPDKIRLFLNDRKNVIYINGRPTGRWNFINLLKNSKGKYIALCEGDDYWTSRHKLQRQVDFLESNSDFAICFHRADWLDQESGDTKPGEYGPPFFKPYYTVDDLLEHCNFIPTCSVIFRHNLFATVPDWFDKIGVGDFPLHILNAQHGKIGFLDESIAVYRKHDGGLYGGQTVLQNCERRVQTYLLIGAKLSLGKRVSHQLGISKQTMNLCRAYWTEGDGIKALLPSFQALLAGFKALIYSSYNKKCQTLIQLIKCVAPNKLDKIIRSLIRICG